MKTTVQIPDEELAEAMEHSGARTKKAAIVAAVMEYNRRRRLEALVARFGRSTEFMTGAELAKLRADERRR